MGADVVIVGAGPVGLWTAIQIKKRSPETEIQIYERHSEYQRSHVLKLEHLSVLLYGKNSHDPHERNFYEEITGKNLSKVFQAAVAAKSVFIRTNDLEDALKTYATALGVQIDYQTINTPQDAMDLNPGCNLFIAADGARSSMRHSLLGNDESALIHYPLQNVVEVKYKANGKADNLDIADHYKTNKIINSMAFEYVGREKDGITPVTLRFFVDKKTYSLLPDDAGFKNPLELQDNRIPESLAQDIRTYMNVRKSIANENYCPDSSKVSKLILSMYASRKFAVNQESSQKWFLAGDAAMGVPYFRALNSGMIIGSQLAFILTRDYLSDNNKVRAYNFVRPFDIGWEFTEARGKDIVLKLYDKFRQANTSVPWETVKWKEGQAHNFQTSYHKAFRPGDTPKP